MLYQESPPMGKLDKKAVFSLHYGDETTTCHGRAIENGWLCHSDVSASSPPYGENTAFSPTFPLVDSMTEAYC